MVATCVWNEGREGELEVGKQDYVQPVSRYMVELENDKGKVIRSMKARFKLSKKR